MKVINATKHFKFILVLFLFPLSSFSQEVPCREWYYTTDTNGNQIKGHCKQAWQVNSDGQKHGKFIKYHENGNPHYIKTFVNGLGNGSFREFKEDGVTITIQGVYLNEERIGKWKWVDDNGFLIIEFGKNEQFYYHWKNLVLKSNHMNGATGDMLFHFRFSVTLQKETGTVVITVNGNENYHHNFVRSNSWIFNDNIERNEDFVYDLQLSKDIINEIIQKLKGSKSIPTDGFVVINFSNGNISSNVPYKIYDSTGHLLN